MNTKNTSAREAARRFWGQKCDTKVKGYWAECAIFTDSVATNGHLIISQDGAEFRDYTPNPEGRVSDSTPNRCRDVIDHYITEAATVSAPRYLYGHLSAEHARHFAVACRGRWMSYAAIDPGAGMYMPDGEVLDVDGVAPFSMRFDSEYFSKIFKRFKVLSVEFVAPTNKEKTNGTARFSVLFKGASFTVVLLQCGAGTANEYAEDLVTDWDRHDRGQDRKGQEAA